MGFVRVSGYNQTDMDNNYQAGIAAADARVNPNSASYSAGCTDTLSGAITINPNNRPAPILTNYYSKVNVHIYNNSGNTLKLFISGDMQDGGTTPIHTLNGTTITIFDAVYDFPDNGDLYLYQVGDGNTNTGKEVYIGVIGNYDNYNNQIVANIEDDITSGYAEFT